MYVQVKKLPEAIRTALESVSYHRDDIKVRVVRSLVLGGSAYADGFRAFTTLVNLATGGHETRYGSWSGPNMFDRINPVDNDDREYVLPDHGVVIKGQSGGGKPVYAVLYIPASMTEHMLPGAPAELSQQEKDALYCHARIRGGHYRKNELSRRNVSQETIDSLVRRGFLKVNRAGAVTITTDGKNALGEYQGY